MHTCPACDTLSVADRLWHGLYVRWHAHRPESRAWISAGWRR